MKYLNNISYEEAIKLPEPKNIWINKDELIVITGESVPTEVISESQEVYTTDFTISNTYSIDSKRFTTDKLERHILSFLDSMSPNKLFGPISVSQSYLFNQPKNSTNNFGALTIANVDQAFLFANKLQNVNTGIRISYVYGGARSQYCIAAFNSIKGAKGFGIEHIETLLPITIGNVIHNDNVQVGSHGLRYTAANSSGTQGAVSSANILCDRLENGVSVQKGVNNLVLTGTVIKNVGQDGFRSNTPELHPGHHLVQLAVIDAGVDAIKLNNLSHCLVDAVTTGAGSSGVRVGSTDNDGHHIVRNISKKDTKSAVVRSNYNHCTIIADECNSYSSIEITGSYNIIDAIVTTGNNVSVYITGNDNILRIIQDGITPIGVLLSGSRNEILMNVKGKVTISGQDNKLSGRILGEITNTGTGNDLVGIFGYNPGGV